MSSGYYSTGNGSIASDVSLDSVRKTIEECKSRMPNRRPPDAIFMSTRALEELLKPSFAEVMPFVADEPREVTRFKYGQLYGIPVYRFDHMSLYRGGVDRAVGPDLHVERVVWVDPVKPDAVPAWHWLVLAAVGALILCLMGGVV